MKNAHVRNRITGLLVFLAAALLSAEMQRAESRAPAVAAPVMPIDRMARVDSGMLEGVLVNGVVSFKGVPFAAPPVSALRWRSPQPVESWTGVRRATEFGHDCMQLSVAGDAAVAGTSPAEDCLVLNVWRPARVSTDRRLPVLVWVHGGGYVNGGTSPAVYDGGTFAGQGIVFVSANYRLGRFGFFAHPALIEANEGPVGNFAYMDQIEALRWVQRNAPAFGGDPEQVTVVGESAGGDMIMHLLTSTQGMGLFHRAVVMSGDGRSHILGGAPLTGGTPQRPSADQLGRSFAKRAGITGEGAEALAALRALPAERVRGDLNMAQFLRRAPGAPAYFDGTILDGWIVEGSPGERLARGEMSKVPIMIGTTSDDLPARIPTALTQPLAYFGALSADAKAVYNPDGSRQLLQIALAVGVDLSMHEPARFVATEMTAAGVPAWLYRYDYVAEARRADTKGAGHATEIPYFFGTLTARYGSAISAQDRAASQLAQAYLVNFVKAGDPNGSGLPTWRRFERDRNELLMFRPDGRAGMREDPLKVRLDLVEQAADRGALSATVRLP